METSELKDIASQMGIKIPIGKGRAFIMSAIMEDKSMVESESVESSVSLPKEKSTKGKSPKVSPKVSSKSKSFEEFTAAELKEMLTKKGITKNIPLSKKERIELLEAETCDPDNELFCTDGKACHVENRICVHDKEDKFAKVLSRTEINGKIVIGDKKVIDKLKARMAAAAKPVSEESVPEESISEESVQEESVPEESISEESVQEESVPEVSVSEEKPALESSLEEEESVQESEKPSPKLGPSLPFTKEKVKVEAAESKLKKIKKPESWSKIEEVSIEENLPKKARVSPKRPAPVLSESEESEISSKGVSPKEESVSDEESELQSIDEGTKSQSTKRDIVMRLSRELRNCLFPSIKRNT